MKKSTPTWRWRERLWSAGAPLFFWTADPPPAEISRPYTDRHTGTGLAKRGGWALGRRRPPPTPHPNTFNF